MTHYAQGDRANGPVDDCSCKGKRPYTSIGVFGIGGAGCSIVQRLRDRCGYDQHVSVCTVNRAGDDGEAALTFASGINGPLTTEDSHLISESVRGKGCVILAAGLCGTTGTALIQDFARRARNQGSKVIAVVALPFRFEGKRVSVAKSTATELAAIADRVITFNLASLSQAFPANTTLNGFMSFADGLAAGAILYAIAATESMPPLPPVPVPLG